MSTDANKETTGGKAAAPKKAAAPRAARKPAASRAKAEAPARERAAVTARPAPRMQVRYRDEVRAQLINEFGYKSSMQAPRIDKITLNIGLGEALTNSRALETAPEQLGAIAGQKPVATKAKKAVAGFKVREGQVIGAKVTLRGRRMYEFLDRLITLALPRIRDFRGVARSGFDGKGNYALGLREQTVFPEIDYSTVDKVRGLQVVFTTTANNDVEGIRLLELMGMPFVRQG